MQNTNQSSCEEQSIQDQLTTAVLCLDNNLCIRYMNTAAEVLFTLSSRKSIGSTLSSLVPIPESLITGLQKTIESEYHFTDREVLLDRPGKDSLLVDCTISPYHSEANPHGLLLEINNVDQQLRIAREKALLNQQEISRSLLRGLAHEIKNPLGGLRGAAQLLEKELPNKELKDYTDIIIREADRLHKLIDRMLGPHRRPKQSAVNVHEVLEYVRKISQADASTDINFTLDYDPSIPQFPADRDHLVQVFLNITGNAITALGAKGNITYRTRISRYFTIGSKIHRLVGIFQVIDDGPGIPPEIQNSVFYPMITGRHDGTGLGLSIAQSLITQSGGLIECSSQPGHTIFSILIPLESATHE